jgi:hypothetical protein
VEALSYALISLPYVVVACIGLALPVLLIALTRRPVVGFSLLGMLCIVEIQFPGLEIVRLGAQLYLPDLVTALLGFAAVLRFLFVDGARPRLPGWYVFLGVVALSMAIGLVKAGSGAGVAARPYFYALAVASYAASFPADSAIVRRLFDTLAWVGATLLLITLVRWVIVVTPIPQWLPPGGRFASSEASELRVIGSRDAVLLAQLLVLLMYFSSTSRLLARSRILLPLLAVAVVVLQHRSVWLACVAGLGARFMLRNRGGTAVRQLVAGALLTLAVIVPLTMTSSFSDASGDITKSASRAIELSGTANARLNDWQSLVRHWYGAGAQSIMIGQPIGTNVERYTSDLLSARKISYQAHNFYVQTLVNTGLIGLGSILFAYGWTLVRLYRQASKQDDGEMAAALFLMLVVQMVYYLPYGIDYMQGMVFGTAMIYSLGHRHAAAQSTHEPIDGCAAPRPPAIRRAESGAHR